VSRQSGVSRIYDKYKTMKPNALMNVSSAMQNFTEVVFMAVALPFWEIKNQF
jgi:hypothetical protein